MIKAQVIADSKNQFGNRITTMVVTFPRIILAEFNTHRMLSKNSASSRAIPFEKMVKSVEENPFIPIAWQKDHKGMQGSEYLTNKEDVEYREHLWLKARNNAIRLARDLNDNQAYPYGTYNPDIKEGGVTKQLCNRLLEPFMWHTVIVTATEWENFFALRCPQYVSGYKLGSPEEADRKIWRSWKDMCNYYPEVSALKDNTVLERLQVNQGQAEIHMMALAEAMWNAMNESIPKELKAGEWHIPFGDNIDDTKLDDTLKGIYDIRKDGLWSLSDAKIKIATARCARVSYTVVGEEGKPDNYEKDIELHDRLLASGHMSPFEHCAKAMDTFLLLEHEKWSGNFRGFTQYRKTIIGENKV